MKRSFKEILAERMREKGMNYEHLARKTGVTSVYVSKIVQGRRVPTDEVIVNLARALDLDLENLILLAHIEKAPGAVKPILERLTRRLRSEALAGVENWDNIGPAALGHGRPVPVVGMVQAGAFMPAEDGEYPAGIADEYVYTDQKAGNVFGVRVEGDSMEPEFSDGDILIVNPNLEGRSGDYVIARLEDDNEATFKKLIVHPGDVDKGPGRPIIILRPLNHRYEDMVFADPSKVRILGRVVERKTLF